MFAGDHRDVTTLIGRAVQDPVVRRDLTDTVIGGLVGPGVGLVRRLRDKLTGRATAP